MTIPLCMVPLRTLMPSAASIGNNVGNVDGMCIKDLGREFVERSPKVYEPSRV